MLAEFGAEVIKVEAPGNGDPLRQWRVLKDGTSLWWSVQARNKKSITLNMKDERAQEIARQLALDADVIIENYRPGVLEKWKLGYEDLNSTPRPSWCACPATARPARCATCRASAPSANRWAACATSPAIRTVRRCASAFPSATPSPRCMA
jgi:hypothetical protein